MMSLRIIVVVIRHIYIAKLIGVYALECFEEATKYDEVFVLHLPPVKVTRKRVAFSWYFGTFSDSTSIVS